MPALAGIAYEAPAYAASDANTAVANDVEAVAPTGFSSALALTSPIFLDEDGPEYLTDSAEASWIWDTIVHVINTAMMVDPQHGGLAPGA